MRALIWLSYDSGNYSGQCMCGIGWWRNYNAQCRHCAASDCLKEWITR